MTDPLTLHPPTTLLKALITTILKDIHPLSKSALQQNGTKLFGAAILHKPTLSPILADTNQEADSPLWHGETYTLTRFFALPASQRPPVKECLFLSTHEPCSLCINAIVWSGFDNFVYLWTYEETAELFGIDGDLKVWAKCFYHDGLNASEGGARQASLDGSVAQRRPEYRLKNELFVARSFAEVLAAIEDRAEQEKWVKEVERCKRIYGSLSPVFRERCGIAEELPVE